MKSPRVQLIFLFSSVAILSFMSSCQKDFLSKDQKNTLFAEPTAQELDNIFNDWQNRDLTATNYTVLQEEEILPGFFKLKIVAYRVAGIKEYGALIIPTNSVSVPVQIWVGGFGLDVTTNSVNVVLDSAGNALSSILAIPALRGQSLEITVNGSVYTTPISEGDHCDAFDGGTDDVLAFLNLIEQTEPMADVNRTGVRGGSRGGAVALLAGIRDSRIKRVIDVVGPTDMFTLTAQHINDPTYQCQFLTAFKNGEINAQEARFAMLASSPLYFAQHLPLVQLHMGLNDVNVPIQQAYLLRDKMEALGQSSQFELFEYNKTHYDIAVDNPEFQERVVAFMSLL